MSATVQPDFIPEPQAYSVPQSARFLGVSTSTVKALLRRRELASRKIGARRVILKSSLEAFLKRGGETGEHRERKED